MIQEFASKIDIWLLLVLMVTMVVSFFGGVSILRSQKNIIGYVSAIFLISVCTIMPLWLLIDTNYTVQEDRLTIKSGPRIWLIPLSSITAIEETNESWSSPALSLDRLKIHYNNGQVVMISPKDKQGFLKAVGYEL